MSPEEFVKSYFEWSGKQIDEIIIERNEYLSKVGQIEQYLYLITTVRSACCRFVNVVDVCVDGSAGSSYSADSFSTYRLTHIHVRVVAHINGGVCAYDRVRTGRRPRNDKDCRC